MAFSEIRRPGSRHGGIGAVVARYDVCWRSTAMLRWFARLAGLVLSLVGVALLLAAAGCADQAGGAARAPELGRVEIALQLGPGVTASGATYEIMRGDFRKAGTLDLSRSATLSAIIDGLPAGTGYRAGLALDASDGARSLACAGSASFDVVAGQVTGVPVHITCHEPHPASPREVPLSPAAIVVLGGLLLVVGFRRRVG